MPLMKMSRNETLGDLHTHFFKSGNILRNKNMNHLAAYAELFPTDVKVEYDLWYDANDRNKVHGYVWTDACNKFIYIRPACTVRSVTLMNDCATSDVTDMGRDLVRHIGQNASDKYKSQKKVPQHYYVIFLPGTNIFDRLVDLPLLRREIEKGAIVKPHPLTAIPLRAYIEANLPKESIANRKLSGHGLLACAKKVGTYTNSEMGLAALAADKTVVIMNDVREVTTYSSIYNAISPGLKPSKERLEAILSRKNSGIIVDCSGDAQERIDAFFAQYESYR